MTVELSRYIFVPFFFFLCKICALAQQRFGNADVYTPIHTLHKSKKDIQKHPLSILTPEKASAITYAVNMLVTHYVIKISAGEEMWRFPSFKTMQEESVWGNEMLYNFRYLHNICIFYIYIYINCLLPVVDTNAVIYMQVVSYLPSASRQSYPVSFEKGTGK